MTNVTLYEAAWFITCAIGVGVFGWLAWLWRDIMRAAERDRDRDGALVAGTHLFLMLAIAVALFLHGLVGLIVMFTPPRSAAPAGWVEQAAIELSMRVSIPLLFAGELVIVVLGGIPKLINHYRAAAALRASKDAVREKILAPPLPPPTMIRTAGYTGPDRRRGGRPPILPPPPPDY